MMRGEKGRRPARPVPRPPQLPAGLAFALAACLLGQHAAAAAAQAAPQQQQRSFMTVVATSVVPRVETRYAWSVSTTADTASVTVPVNSNTGWPQVRYTVSYVRNREPQTVYVLSGGLQLANKDALASAINLPNVTVTTSAGASYAMPPEAISCPSLVVPAGGLLNCTFAAGYIGPQPLPGRLRASVSLAGTLLPIQLQSAAVEYDFTAAEQVATGVFAVASNYFELGPGIMQPYGVSGEQPPPGLRLEDSRTFSFIAVFGSLTASNCGRDWQAINTAELTPSSSTEASSMPAPKMKTSQTAITVLLSGCTGAAPGFSEQTGAPAVPAPAPVGAPAALPPEETPRLPPAPAPLPDVPGVEFAEAGSTLCGRGVCPKGQRCFDGWNCCPIDTPVCGGSCCQAPSTCQQNRCIPPGGTPCGTLVCQAGETCATSGVCCAAGTAPCGKACCAAGLTCLQGVCAAPGSQVCGATVCAATQVCVAGVCCAPGETACGGRCCAGGNVCLQGAFCAPAGSSVCAGQICNAPQQCAGGVLCCDAGASFCGGACCPATNLCQADRCLTAGQSICGAGLICGVGQSCQGGIVCCDQGATFCNNACCPQGNVCINNVCAVQGSVACGPNICPPNQICGDTQTGVCCQSLQQFGCGRTCCNSLTQVCNQFTQQCAERFNQCPGGQFWCAGANICCPQGTICSFNQCVPRNAFGRKL